MVLLNSSVPKTSLPLEFTSMATSTSWSPTSLRASITSVRKVSSIRSSESCSLFRSHHSETLFPQFWVRRRVCSKSLQMIGGYSSRKSAIRCEVIPITEREFEEKVLKSDLPVLVEFVASWCGPCRLITPAIEWAAKEYKDKLKIMKIDCDSSPQLVDEYKVYGLPTLIVFNDGKEVPESRSEGAMTKAKLEEYLNSHLNSVTVT